MARGLVEHTQILKPNSEAVRMVYGALLLYVMHDHKAARIEAEASLLGLAPDFNLSACDPWPFRDSAEWTPFQDALAACGAPVRLAERFRGQ